MIRKTVLLAAYLLFVPHFFGQQPDPGLIARMTTPIDVS
jgi:hypothetical protein